MVPLAGTDVRGLRAFLALRHLVGHLLPFVEVPETLTRDRAEVHEHICAAVVGRDEAEALLGAEPLDGACCHVRSLLPSPSGPGCLPVGLRLAPGGNRSWRTMINCPHRIAYRPKGPCRLPCPSARGLCRLRPPACARPLAPAP